MTDKEKIEQIIKDKGLNNSQFCNMVGIAPGTLSHIISGRTNPTLNILRSIKFVFPDINPSWLFSDEGPMYKDEESDPTPEDANPEAETFSDDDVYRQSADYYQADLFGPQPKPGRSATPTSNAGLASQPSVSSHLSARTPNPVGSESVSPNSMAMASHFDVAGIVEETVKQLHRPQRKIVEVRIFFDDGTFETFGNR